MKKDAIPCPALNGCPCGDGNRFAGVVANPHHDLQPKQSQLLKAEITQQGDRLSGDAAALAGLPHPVTDIAVAMMGRQLVDTSPTQELAGSGAENAHIKGASRRAILIAGGKPGQRLLPVERGSAPAHPAADRFDGFVDCADKLIGVARLEGADDETGVGKGLECHWLSCVESNDALLRGDLVAGQTGVVLSKAAGHLGSRGNTILLNLEQTYPSGIGWSLATLLCPPLRQSLSPCGGGRIDPAGVCL